MSVQASAVHAVLTWAVVLGVCALVVAFFYLVGVLVDMLADRHRDHSLDEVLRQDRAREAMRRWTEDQ